jgi:hypothetical protein
MHNSSAGEMPFAHGTDAAACVRIGCVQVIVKSWYRSLQPFSLVHPLQLGVLAVLRPHPTPQNTHPPSPPPRRPCPTAS